MGVGANNSGNRSLDQERERNAGRQDQKGPQASAVKEFFGEPQSKPVGGAFGKDGVANRDTANAVGEGGGGGGGATTSDIPDIGASGNVKTAGNDVQPGRQEKQDNKE